MKASSTLGVYLKHSTRSAHQQLDQHPVLRPLVQPSLQLPDYRRALRALYPAQYQLEHAVCEALDRLQLHYPLLLRAPVLADDLLALDLDVPAHKASSTLTLPTPNVTGMGHLVGLLYVLEGSRLGSLVIARNIHRTLGLQMASEYFSVAKEANSWQHFWQFAEYYCPEAQWSAAAQAADDAFQLFAACLDAGQTTDSLTTA